VWSLILQELLREANITGDTTWEQARPLLELNATFASLPEAERRLAFDAAVAEKKRQARRRIYLTTARSAPPTICSLCSTCALPVSPVGGQTLSM
jgi:FF domain